MNGNSRPRGFSLIETMIALAVLTIGLLGAMQATIVISGSNSGASKMTRATAVASQVRAALEARKREGLIEDGFFDTCATDLDDRAGGLTGLTTPFSTSCVVDLDDYDANNPPIVPGYSTADAEVFRRLVVRISDSRDTTVDLLGVVVTWNDGSRLMTHRQVVGLYNRTTISASTEL